MGERGTDWSEWQAGADAERVSVDNGLSFAMVRTNYGSEHDDAQFHRFCDGFERAGVLVTPYVYPLATDTYGSIDDAVRIIGGRYDRVIVDWEVGSGGGDHLRAAHERVWEHGLNTPLVYDPAWYAAQQGNPDQSWMGQSGRIGGRWKSWYPDYVAGSFDAILAKLPASVWNDNRGGIPTRIVQFTSSGRLNGWGGNLDLNYFPGSREELESLLGGGTMSVSDAWNGFSQALQAAAASVAAGDPDDVAKSLRAILAPTASAWDGVAQMLNEARATVEAGAPNDIALALRAILPASVGGDVQIDYAKLAGALGPQFADQVSTMTADKLAARLKD